MADEGKNIRSVIKNATQGGLGSRLGGIGDTIATKEEIIQNKEKPEAPKMSAGPKLGVQTPSLGGLNGGLNLKKAQSTAKSEVVSQPKVEQGGQNMAGGVSISQQPPVSSPFQNQMNEPINNINIEQFNNESITKSPIDLNLRKGVPATLRLKELDKDRKKRMSKGVENLYIDAYNKNVNGGELTIEDVLANKNYQQQLKGMDENVLAEMINDANYLAQFDYSTDNVLALMDKYKDLGLDIDMDNLPPQTKAQYIAANLEGNDGGLGGFVDHISPMNMPAEMYEGITGVNPRDYNEKMQQWAQESKHDFLTDTELEEMISDARKVVDNKYKDYYYNQTEEMFTDRKVGEQFYKDVAKLRKENKGMSEEEAVAKVMKEGKYNGVSYEKLPHETVDQGRFWKDKDKEKEYNKVIKELEGKAKKAHGDTRENWWRNLGLDATLVVGQGLDLVRNPGSLVSGLASMTKGAVHKSIEGYADLLDTWIATTESAIGAIKGENEWEGIQYRVGDVGEKVAKKKGYKDYDEMVMKMEQASEDNPGLKIATWFLKQGEKDLNTANALGDYLVNAYGSWEAVKEMANENQAQMASDIISIIQLGTMGAVKMGLIDAMKGEQIIKMAGYGDLYEQTLKWGNKLQFGPMLKGEMAVAKAGAKVVGAPFKLVGNFTETFVNKLSGITKEERDFIKKNPEKVEEFLKGDKNSQSLLDRIIERFEGLQLEKKLEGEEYEKIKNSNAPVKIKDILSNISKRLKEAGLQFTNEGIKVNKNYTPAINKKFEELGVFLDELRNKGNSATAEDVRWARRQIDTLAKWEGQPAGLEADAIGLIRDVRGILDAELKRQIPDMKVLDDSYKKTIEEVKEMKKDWFNKDGTLKDSAYSKIRNLTNKGSNQPKLARLEKLLPGITEELKGLAVAESVEKAGKQMVGQYANQIFGVGGGIVGITSLLSGGLSAGPIILGILGATLATPKNLVKLLKYQGKVSKGFKNIISKIENGIKLTPAETLEFTRNLNDNQAQLKKDARYLYEKGLITDEEYKMALKNEEKDYAMAVDKARAKLGDKEKALKDKEKGKIIEDTKKKAKNIGFVTEIEKGLKDENGGKVLGLADVKNKIIKLSKNLTDTTAQHELFHAVMSVVDGKTRKYVIDEAKKILKNRGISDVNAEEWLAESFGVYAKRKQVNLGVLDNVKWGEGKIRNTIENLFQRVYEWLQNYNGDRKTINKLFDEILDDKVKIGENGGVDLSYLLGEKEVKAGEGVKGNGLRYKKAGEVERKGLNRKDKGNQDIRYKKGRHGSPYSFDKFDSSHMGEGEGAQAHGWGHYVAMDKETGYSYSKLQDKKTQYRGEGYRNPSDRNGYGVSDKDMLIDEFLRELDRGEKYEDVKGYYIEQEKDIINDCNRWLKEAKKEGVSELEGFTMEEIQGKKKLAQEKIDLINSIKKEDFIEVGHNLYEVEIPDPVKKDTPTGSNYLEEDKYYSKDEVKKFLGLIKNIDSGWLKDTKESRIYDLYKKGLDIRGKDLYDMLAYAKGDKQASKFLESLGYDGIHYYGGMDGEAYVIFNDNAPQIQNHIRYKKVIENNREDMKKDLIERAKSGFYDRLKGEQDEFLDDVAKATGSYAVKAPLKYGSKGYPEFGIANKKGERILDKGMHKEGGIRDVNDVARGTIRVDTIGDIYKVVDYIKKNYKNVSDFDDKYANPTPMGYVDYSLLFEGSEGGKAETQINATPMIVAKEKMKDALNYGISEEEYNEIVKKSGTKGGGLGHTFYDEQRGIEKKLVKGGLSRNEKKFLIGRIKTLARDSRNYYDAYMKLLKK